VSGFGRFRTEPAALKGGELGVSVSLRIIVVGYRSSSATTLIHKGQLPFGRHPQDFV
jgi:hypothetical protein